MSRPFKNALCGDGIPDAHGYGGMPPFALRCKRRARHAMPHRVVFRDGGVREWNDGDRESRLIKKPREGVPRPLPLSILRAEIEAGTAEIDPYEIGGCGCFSDVEDAP